VPGARSADSVRLDQLSTAMRARLLFLVLFAWVLPAFAAAPRIATLAPNLTELVFAAGAGEQLVATVAYSDYPAAARDIPLVGDAFRVAYEALRRLRPDVVLTWESGTPRVTVERLLELGFRVEEFEPRTVDDIANEIERIGKLAGSSATATTSAAGLREEFTALREVYADRPRLRVFYQISANPWYTVSGQHVISEVLGICGGDNVFADVPGLAPPVSQESILRQTPEVLVAGTLDDAWQGDWRLWQNLPAVATGALFKVDPDLVNRATPRLLEGARQICSVLDQARELYSEASEHGPRS